LATRLDTKSFESPASSRPSAVFQHHLSIGSTLRLLFNINTPISYFRTYRDWAGNWKPSESGVKGHWPAPSSYLHLIKPNPLDCIMHFAMPPRKTSQPPPYARASRSSPIRRKQLQTGALVICAFLVIVYLATTLFSSSSSRTPTGTPEVVIVSALDRQTMSEDYRRKIMENRNYYAAKQGTCTILENSRGC